MYPSQSPDQLSPSHFEIEVPEFGIKIPETIFPLFNDLLVTSIDQQHVRSLMKGMCNFINLCVKEKISAIFFLDRNARPAALFFRMLWRKLYPTTPHPSIKFLSVSTLRNRLTDNHPFLELKNRFKEFDQSKIMIADEYTETGDTLRLAEKILASTYPQATFITSGIFNRAVFWDSNPEVLHVTRTEEDDKRLIVRPAELEGQNRRKFISSYFQYFANKIAETCEKVPIASLDPKPYVSFKLK